MYSMLKEILPGYYINYIYIYIDRVSIESRPTVHRLSTDISTDISVDVSVESAYSKHDPDFFRLVMSVGQRKNSECL